MGTLREQASDPRVLDAPQEFRVGATWDGQRLEGGISYTRRWSNLWGLSAYARAYWHDQAVVPTNRFGVAAGFDVTKRW